MAHNVFVNNNTTISIMDKCVIVLRLLKYSSGGLGLFTSLHLFFLFCIVQFLSLCGSCSVSVLSVSVLLFVVVGICAVVASVLVLSFTCCRGGWFFKLTFQAG
jgi:hypothetical protein